MEFLIATVKEMKFDRPCKPSPQRSAEDTSRTRSHGNRLLDSKKDIHLIPWGKKYHGHHEPWISGSEKVPKVAFVRDHRGDVFWKAAGSWQPGLPQWLVQKLLLVKGCWTQSKERQQQVMSADLVSARMETWWKVFLASEGIWESMKSWKVCGLQRMWEVLLQRCFSFSHKSQECDACIEDEFHQYPFQATAWPLPQPFQFHLSLSTHWPLSPDLAIKQSIVVACDARRASWGLDSTLPIHWPLLCSEPQEVTPEIRLKNGPIFL